MRFIVLAVVTTLLSCGWAISAESENHIQIQPVPRSAVLKDHDYIVWGASMVQSEDGTCHLFYCRWKGRLVRDWYMSAEIVHATATTPLGPYVPKDVVLSRRPEGAAMWDGLAAYNPTVKRFGDKYYLYYTGCNGSNRRVLTEGNILAQRIGVAVADHPDGPWERRDKPLIDLSEGGIDSGMCCNPTVTQGPDGRFMMIYKAADIEKTGIFLTVAFADTPTGPFKKTQQKILTHPTSSFPVEDPFLWWQDGKYRCVLDDQHGDFSGEKGLILFESNNGLNWKKSDPFVLTRCRIAWDDGVVDATHHLERPQIWLKDGKPTVLFAAVSEGEQYYNVHIPLQSTEPGASN